MVDDLSERIRLFEENKSYVPGIVSGYCSGRMDPNLLQVGLIGCWEATGRYDPSRGVKFRTYMRTSVIGAIKHEFRDRGRMIRIPAYKQEKDREFEVPCELVDSWDGREPPAPPMEDPLPTDILRAVVPPDLHQALEWLLLHALQGLTWTEIAEQYGRTRGSVDHSVRQVRRILRNSPDVRDWADIGKGD